MSLDILDALRLRLQPPDPPKPRGKRVAKSPDKPLGRPKTRHRDWNVWLARAEDFIRKGQTFRAQDLLDYPYTSLPFKYYAQLLDHLRHHPKLYRCKPGRHCVYTPIVEQANGVTRLARGLPGRSHIYIRGANPRIVRPEAPYTLDDWLDDLAERDANEVL